MKIFSYNLNGIRAAVNKGLVDWLKEANPDIVCLQELKANSDQLDISAIEDLGYKMFWNSAEKKGYSGVAILSKIAPENISIGCGIERYDREGRIIRADFSDFSVMSVYIPSGSSGEDRQQFKMEFLDDFIKYVARLKKEHKNLIISGDFNICHKPIDIHNPVSNKKSSGFLPEEREWLTEFIDKGFIDTFRHFNPNPHRYSWWSFRFNARAKNLGWRIDYIMATREMEKRLKNADIMEEIVHSDHCPILLEIE